MEPVFYIKTDLKNTKAKHNIKDLRTKQKWSHRCRKQTYGYQGIMEERHKLEDWVGWTYTYHYA